MTELAHPICDATTGWSDGVITRCQLMPGHDGVHRDDRYVAINPLPTGTTTVEWGIRYDDDRVEHCSEATAHLLAAPGVTPVRRVVGAWQDTTPNPPAQTSKENGR